jgi:hypothetical protein
MQTAVGGKLFRGRLKIADIQLECFVLPSGRCLLDSVGIQQLLDQCEPPSVVAPAVPVQINQEQPYRFPKTLQSLLAQLREGLPPLVPVSDDTGQLISYGYDTETLRYIAASFHRAEFEGLLASADKFIVERLHAFHELVFENRGIDCLIEMETGFLCHKNRQFLESILDNYLLPEEAFWAKQFPQEFWHKLAGLIGNCAWSELKRPSVVGRWVTDLVFARLSPQLKLELMSLCPIGKPKVAAKLEAAELVKYSGVNTLIAHVDRVTELMECSTNQIEFKRLLNRSVPRRADDFSYRGAGRVSIGGGSSSAG